MALGKPDLGKTTGGQAGRHPDDTDETFDRRYNTYGKPQEPDSQEPESNGPKKKHGCYRIVIAIIVALIILAIVIEVLVHSGG